ncbi:restriction endonuclease [Marinomonas shanghaiensis]|uniref:restriction endonuclease n=1 Tax=Marinomonas shanghaiensis TaxID=2202418 RepID=UPI0018E4FF61|nr:restriction endonuclease [Marinomonas shanghaiensis]
MKDGRAYEEFVGRLHEALLRAEDITAQKNIQVERNKKLIDNCGVAREFDLYWEYELAGVTYKTVIECKDYKSTVSVEKIDALIGKIRDFPDLRALFATKRGYQSGAIQKARQNRIDLLIVREQNESDWTSLDGTPLIRTVRINMHIQAAARIKNFAPTIDGDWVKQNTNIDVSKALNMTGRTDEIVIEDAARSQKYSLHEMTSRLGPKGDLDHGEFEDLAEFEEAYLLYNGLRLKMRAFRLVYEIGKPHDQPIEIDLSKELVGVIEYLQRGAKTSIFKNGVIKTDDGEKR